MKHNSDYFYYEEDEPDCEKSYKDRLKLHFQKNSMLYKFWLYLFRRDKKKKKSKRRVYRVEK